MQRNTEKRHRPFANRVGHTSSRRATQVTPNPYTLFQPSTHVELKPIPAAVIQEHNKLIHDENSLLNFRL